MNLCFLFFFITFKQIFGLYYWLQGKVTKRGGVKRKKRQKDESWCSLNQPKINEKVCEKHIRQT
jgi:hypothetical protein